MLPLTDKRIAKKMLKNAEAHPLERQELISFLEYVFYVTSPKVTVSDFVDSARLAAKAFAPKKRVERLGSLAQLVNSYFAKTDPMLNLLARLEKSEREVEDANTGGQ